MPSIRSKISKTQKMNRAKSELKQTDKGNLFFLNFNPENTLTLKLKLAQQESLKGKRDIYVNPSCHQFRDEVILANKTHFKVINKQINKLSYRLS